MTHACPRLFQAEAMRDGRLTGAELASFERHMTACPACLREVRALEGLAEAVRASARIVPDANELHVRRERTRLLAAFDRALVAPEQPRSRVRRRLLRPATAGVLVASALAFWHMRSGERPPHVEDVAIHADRTAVWSRRTRDDREQVMLERGALFIHVDHAAGARGGLVIVLPDGELEDTGTTFTVSVQDGHTQRVTVRQGSVVLRLRGQPEVALGPGDTWLANMQSACPSAAAAAAPIPAHDAKPAFRGGAQGGGHRSARLSAPVPAARQPQAPAPRSPAADASEASLDFRAAMAAFDRGDHRQAAAAFAGFLAAHPHDSQAQDAAYLRVIALQRCGDDDGMQAAALEYLRRFPAGFRHAEVGALVR